MVGLGVEWKRVDVYGKMGVSKIIREIVGIVGNEWDWVRGKLGERVGLSGNKGLVNWVKELVWVVLILVNKPPQSDYGDRI